MNWWNGKFSLYNLLPNSEKKSEKNQIFILDENQKLAIQVMFKQAVNEGDEDDNIIFLMAKC